MANTKSITREQLDDILDEARSDYTEVPVVGALKAGKPAASISISSFKSAWPTKIRPALMFAITVMKMFGQGRLAEYVAQAIGILDLFVGGQIGE